MTWIGATVCFLFWVGYGWHLKGKVSLLQQKVAGLSRGTRVFLGSGGLVVGLLILVAGMAGLAWAGAADAAGIKWWAWPVILALGLLFVHFQVWGALSFASLLIGPETPRRSNSSGTPETKP